MKPLKIAMTGTSGSGKTTLCHWLKKEFHLKHISGSAGDIKGKSVEAMLVDKYHIKPNMGHTEVIKNSAIDFEYGITNQIAIQNARHEIIKSNTNFITDRSPLDNFTYFVSQLGFHKECTEDIIWNFKHECFDAWADLTHVIFLRPCQPDGIEDNGSRVANKYYQKAVDAQFKMWLDHLFMPLSKNIDPSFEGPFVLEIDYWEWEKRTENVSHWLNQTTRNR